MKMKKILSIALALILVIGMLAGCGGKKIEQADISQFTDTDEKLTLEWLGYATLSGCEEGTAPELLLESKFNVEIKPIFADGTTYTDKKNALLQSGDIPDLIYELDPMHVFADARDEYLLEIPHEAIEEYAPSLYNELKTKVPAVWTYSYYEGANYGLPNLNHSHMNAKFPNYRGDWLEKLDLEVPETLDELHDALYAFTHDDPDGNGKNDTYGYAPYSAGHYQWYFADIFGAYGVLPFDWQEVDGEIVYGGMREECEEVLAVLAQWYKEGIIYPAFVESPDAGWQLMQSGKIGYIPESNYSNPNNVNSEGNMLKERYPGAYITYGKAIKGPNGDYGSRNWGYPCHIVSFGNTDEQSPVKATRMLKMFETLFTDEALFTEVRFGKEGEHYTYDTDSTASGAFVPTENYAEIAQRRLAGYEFNTSGPSFWTPFAPTGAFYAKSSTNAYNEWKDTYGDPNAILVDVFYKVDIVPSAATYIEDLRNGQMALMTEIIMGKKSADSYIEEFTKIWNSTGGPQMMEEAVEHQGIIDEIYGKLGIK